MTDDDFLKLAEAHASEGGAVLRVHRVDTSAEEGKVEGGEGRGEEKKDDDPKMEHSDDRQRDDSGDEEGAGEGGPGSAQIHGGTDIVERTPEEGR